MPALTAPQAPGPVIGNRQASPVYQPRSPLVWTEQGWMVPSASPAHEAVQGLLEDATAPQAPGLVAETAPESGDLALPFPPSYVLRSSPSPASSPVDRALEASTVPQRQGKSSEMVTHCPGRALTYLQWQVLSHCRCRALRHLEPTVGLRRTVRPLYPSLLTFLQRRSLLPAARRPPRGLEISPLRQGRTSSPPSSSLPKPTRLSSGQATTSTTTAPPA